VNNKPLNPKLPGRYSRMTTREMNAVVAELERPIALSETRPMTSAEHQRWRQAKRRPGRPRRGKGVRVISLSVEQTLLVRADLAAKRAGISRAALFEIGLMTVLNGDKRLAG
jgi:hypothetical protein